MKKISHWAKHHRWSARIIIVASFIIMNILGVVTGILLKDLNVSISYFTLFVFISVYLFGLVLYPSKRGKRKWISASSFYAKQKSCDLLLAASTFCMIVYIGNHPENLFRYSRPLNAAVITSSSLPRDSIFKNYKSIKDFNASMQLENGNKMKWKERKKLLKEQVKGIKGAGDLSNGEKTLLVILSVIVAMGLFALIGALSCNLSCSGSEGAATLVLVGGTVAIIILLVVAIRAIYGKKKKKKDTEPVN